METTKSKTQDSTSHTTTPATKSSKNQFKKKAEPIVESWEDELDSGEEDQDPAESAASTPEQNSDAPLTEDTRTAKLDSKESGQWNPYDHGQQTDYNASRGASRFPDRRPEKSTAVVSRMLAGSLGLRVKRTEEQRKFDRAQIDNEKKRRDAEKAKKEEEEQQKKSIWED
jgi:hypothetical protein